MLRGQSPSHSHKVQTRMKMLPILLAAAFPLSAAAMPTITFNGEVTAQTCQVKVNEEVDGVVFLPTVSTKELSAAGATAGQTPFTISVSGCKATQADVAIALKLLGRNVTANGNLGNTATANAAGNVAVTLGAADGTRIALQGLTNVPGLILPANQTSASMQLTAQYTAEGKVTPGVVTAVAEYTVSYL